MQWNFENYRLDTDNAVLSRDEEQIVLRPKTFDVLRYLVVHAGELVRKVFGDTAKDQRFITTVYRRGYRFIDGTLLKEFSVFSGEAEHGGNTLANLGKLPEDEVTRIALEVIPSLRDKPEEAIAS